MYTSHILILIITILILVIYINYYNKYKKDYQLIQTHLDKIDLDILNEKYPIIIYDRIINPNDLLKTLFKYIYIFKKFIKIKPIFPTINYSKYMLIWNNDEDIMINIINPKYYKLISWKKINSFKISKYSLYDNELEKVQYITISLKKNQVFILPPFWIYQSNSYINIIQLNDIISIWYNIFLF